MKEIYMRKFCGNIAEDYSRDRLGERDEYKKEEWKIIGKYVSKNQKILDLCCGPGAFLVPLSKKYNIEGIDFSEGMLKQAKEFAKKEKVKIKTSLGDATNIRRKDNNYGLILLMGDSIGSIPKSENRQKVIDECFRILRNNGILIITFGNRNYSAWWYLKGMIFYLWRLATSYFGNERVEYGDWIYELYGRKGMHHGYSEKEAVESLEKAGFKIESILKTSHKIIFVAKK